MPALRTPRSRLLLTAAFVAIAALMLWAAIPAGAHTEITGTQPAEGAELKKPPKEVTLTFAEPPLSTGLAVVLQGKDGPLDLDADVRGNTVVAAWPADTAGGQYRVSYRVVAADGHPITGQVSFSVAGPERTETPSASAIPEPITSSSASAAAAAAVESTDSSDPAIPYWLWAVGAGLIVAAAYVLIARRRNDA